MKCVRREGIFDVVLRDEKCVSALRRLICLGGDVVQPSFHTHIPGDLTSTSAPMVNVSTIRVVVAMMVAQWSVVKSSPPNIYHHAEFRFHPSSHRSSLAFPHYDRFPVVPTNVVSSPPPPTGYRPSTTVTSTLMISPAPHHNNWDPDRCTFFGEPLRDPTGLIPRAPSSSHVPTLVTPSIICHVQRARRRRSRPRPSIESGSVRVVRGEIPSFAAAATARSSLAPPRAARASPSHSSSSVARRWISRRPRVVRR